MKYEDDSSNDSVIEIIKNKITTNTLYFLRVFFYYKLPGAQKLAILKQNNIANYLQINTGTLEIEEVCEKEIE